MKLRSWALCALFAVGLASSAFIGCGDDDDDTDASDDDDGDDDDDDTDDDAGDESVWTDDVTDLGWQNGSEVGENNLAFDAAEAYCGDLVWAGFDDWRLPTISELRSLIRGCDDTMTGGSCQVRDDCTNSKCWTTRCGGCGDATGPGEGGAFWPEGVSGAVGDYWSSTAIPGEAAQRWPVQFRFGAVFADTVPLYGVRCVRGAESGVTDETGEAYKVGHFLMSDLEFTPIANAACEVVALDGEAPDEPYVVDSGTNGYCEAIFNFPIDNYSMDVFAAGYRDTHVVNLPALPWDAGGNAPVWADVMLSDETLAELTAAAGVTQDPSKGIVWGTAHWISDADIFDESWEDMVGCATVAPDAGLFYVDAFDTPDPGRTETDSTIAGWYVFNAEPGTVEYTVTADGQSESTGEATVYPDALTIVMSQFRAPEYPDNPMPDGCP